MAEGVGFGGIASGLGGMNSRYCLMNAYELSQHYPDTFMFPGFEAVLTLRVGDFAKICVEFEEDQRSGCSGERFWVHIVGTVPDSSRVRLTGVIDNDLQHGDIHGLGFGDRIDFEPHHVLAIGRANGD